MQYANSFWSNLKVMLVVIVVLFLALCMLPKARGQSASDEASIRALAEKFFAAYQKEDLEGLLALWSDKAPDLALHKQAWQKTFADNERIELKSISIGKFALEGDKASLRVRAEMSAWDAKTGKPATGFGVMNRTFKLVKEGGAWKIWEYKDSERELAGVLAVAKTGAERKALLESEKDSVTVELVNALIIEGQNHLDQDHDSQALSVFQIAIEIAEQLGYKKGVAAALRRIGNIHYFQHRYTQALEFYRKSLKIGEELGDKELITRALSNVALILSSQGDNAQAIQYYEKSIRLDEALGDKPGLARTLNNLAIAYVDLGYYDKAIDVSQKVLKLAEEIKRSYGKDYGESFRALSTIGNVYSAQGNNAKALQFYQKCLKIAEEWDDPEALAISLNNIGGIYLSQSNYARALEIFMKAMNAAQKSGDKVWIAASLVSIGLVRQSQFKYDEALESFQKGRDILRELNGTDESRALVGMGDIYYAQGRYAEALEYYNKCLRIKEEAGEKPDIATILTHIGRVYRKLGSYAKAIEVADRAAEIARESNKLWTIADARTVEGRTYRDLARPEQARQAFADAIAAVEMLRGQVAGGEQEQQRFFENEVSPYYWMVELLVEKNNYAEAFAYAERAKGRVLLDVLQSGKANITKAVTEAEAEQERKLRGEIINLNKQISRENSLQQPDTARLAELKANLQKARLAFESFQTDLYVAHPELKVQRGEVRSLTLDQTSKLLDQKTAFLEFVFGEDVSYLFVLTKAEKTNKRSESELDLKTYKLSVKGKDLTARVENFRQLLAERNLDYQESARELYDLIIKPAQQQLRGKTVLGIIPDGALWELPFQALQPREGRFLLEDCAIFYAPSLSVLREIVERSIGLGSMQARAKAEKIVGADKGKEFNLSRYGENSRLILLAFGNPALNGETVSLAKSVYRDEPLGSLPEAETEVKTLARIYGPGRSKILIGAEARESLAKSEASRYRILHFATHGILDDFNPLYSHLLLTAQDGDVTEDGLLEAWEIMRMNLQADLVVLSACQTARGKVGAGEGMIGMTWALFVAGSPTTLASQWKVDSASTTELMIKFHSRLTSRGPKGQAVTKAEALRGAVQELMKDRKYRHPFYWAGFVLVGNGF